MSDDMRRSHASMSEVAALRRVAEAVGAWRRSLRPEQNTTGPMRDLIEAHQAAVYAIPALPTEAPGEMVEVRSYFVWCDVTNRWEVHGYMNGTPPITNEYWRVAATITARVPLPRIPEIVATVEPAP